MGLLQIAILGSIPDSVLKGVRELGADRVAVVGPPSAREAFDEVKQVLDPLKVPTEFYEIEGEPLMGTIRIVQDIVHDAQKRKLDVLLNIGGADRTLTCSGLSAGFVAGVRTFDVIDGEIVHLPVLRFSYEEVIGPPKVAILQGLQSLGGSCANVHALAQAAGIEGSATSYHIRGGREGPGLEDLGLVKVVRKEGGGFTIELTPMGETLASGLPEDLADEA